MIDIQKQHEELVDAANKSLDVSFTKRKKGLPSDALNQIDHNDARYAGIAVARLLNLQSGSGSTHDLYALLTNYLLKPDKRAEINKIIGK